MTREQFRVKVWNALFTADYQERYWRFYEFWIDIIFSILKIVFGIAGVLSIAALFLAPEYQFWAALVGAIAATISTIVLPALQLDTAGERITGVRCGWIDVKNGYQLIWDDIEDETMPKLEKQFRVWEERRTELQRRKMSLPVIARFQRKADQETRKLLK